MHLTSRHDLIAWLAEHAPNRAVQRAIDRGKTTHHGLFKGGWVVSTEYGGQTWVVGIRPVGIPPRLTCGLLSGVPWKEYVGGDGVLACGDKGDER
ncbi:MAG: hypothetical protein ACYTEW_27515 [Planctomycetota bacterium]|jgi:hypothetical protein